MDDLVFLWRERARLLREVAALVASNAALSKGLSWMADGYEHCAEELATKR